jgi:serine/threonine protein kinase
LTHQESSGDWFLRYRFRQPLGQGGMGVIYLAEDKRRDSSFCVVKQLILKDDQPGDYAEAVRLFKREIEVLRQLQHVGIVRFFDSHVTDDAKYFLVMDYVPGENLATIVKNYGCFSSEATVEIGIQCCEILEYLHEREPAILYRDLKPSNIMLTPEGQIVFIDFGIARAFAPKTDATRVVTTGYSPPEQYFGRPEIRSDLYALGATLGELLTGIRPKALTVSVPKQHNRTVLNSLDDLVQRLTSHSPEDRPSSARIVRYELYRIYNEIHPDFVVPEEARYPYTGLTQGDRTVIEEDLRASQTKLTYKTRTQTKITDTRMHAQRSRFRGENVPNAQINDSILWDGIRRMLQLFKR